MSMVDQARSFVVDCLESALYVLPQAPGLSMPDLVELGKQASDSFGTGSVTDALKQLASWGYVELALGRYRLTFDGASDRQLTNFAPRWDPDPRNVQTFTVVYQLLREREDEHGRDGGAMSKALLVSLAVDRGCSEHDVLVALLCMWLDRKLLDSHGDFIQSEPARHYMLPVEQSGIHPNLRGRPKLAAALELVERLFGARSGQTAPEQQETVTWPPDVPVKLLRITINNARVLADLSIDLHPPDAGGQWVVFLGDNGVGKSTLLRSLALCLVEKHVATSILTLFSETGSFVSVGTSAATMHVDLPRGRLELQIESRAGADVVEVASSSARPLVFGYGSQRGTALGGPRRDVSLKSIDRVKTLFDDNASLIHAETWLRELAFAASRSKGDAVLFTGVKKTIVSLLPGFESMCVEPDGVFLDGPLQAHQVPIASLSDGYLTTIGWVIDMIAHWTKVARRSEGFSGERFNERMAGVVLLDELDLHLHPSWQTRIVEEVRRAFPRMTFVATTHNPLTLHGSRDGEVFVLHRDDDNNVGARQLDVPPGRRADQLLTGEWFGLRSTLDRDTLEKLDEHRDLLRKQVPEDDADRKRLEAILNERLGSHVGTSLESLAQSVVAEYLDEQRTPTDEDVANMKSRLQQLLTDAKREA